MARAPMELHLKKYQLHKDVGKAPGVKLTTADIAKEKSKGGIYDPSHVRLNSLQGRTSVSARKSCEKWADQSVAVT